VGPLTLSISIARPPAEVFEYLADVANHAEFSDHYLLDWHLTRVDSYGRGAGARFRIAAPGARFNWADVTLAEVDPPHRIVETGYGGKFNRIKTTASYTLEPAGDGVTRVEFSCETEPATVTDRLIERLGAQRWMRRKATRALERLRSILEDDRDRGRRATIAGA